MQIIISYFAAHEVGKNTKFFRLKEAEWEAFIDTASTEKLTFGYVSSKKFVARPTKRQLRELKRTHRKTIELMEAE